jgi:nucleoid DNA-binding protein
LTVLKYILQTLQEHDCVIVPGFGGFLKEDKSAEINPISHVFTPPSSTLAFNPSLQKDDGLLKSELSMGLKIGLQEAGQQIKQFVEALSQKLKDQGKTSIEGLGVFMLDGTKVIFTPIQSLNFNIEGYALHSFVAEPLSNEQDEMAHPRPIPPARRVVRREVVKEVSAKVERTSEDNEEQDTKAGLRVFLIALPILFVMSVGGYFGYNYLKNNFLGANVLVAKETPSKTDEASLLGSVIDSSADTTSKVDNQEEIDYSNVAAVTDENTSTSTLASDTKTEFVVPVTSSSSSTINQNLPYQAIAGVFSTQTNADKYVRKNGGQVIEIDGMYKVSVASYSSLKIAIDNLKTLKTTYGEDLWVTKLK